MYAHCHQLNTKMYVCKIVDSKLNIKGLKLTFSFSIGNSFYHHEIMYNMPVVFLRQITIQSLTTEVDKAIAEHEDLWKLIDDCEQRVQTYVRVQRYKSKAASLNAATLNRSLNANETHYIHNRRGVTEDRLRELGEPLYI